MRQSSSHNFSELQKSGTLSGKAYELTAEALEPLQANDRRGSARIAQHYFRLRLGME
jgi:hypothetical protein